MGISVPAFVIGFIRPSALLFFVPFGSVADGTRPTRPSTTTHTPQQQVGAGGNHCYKQQHWQFAHFPTPVEM
jgi:hypothetical protein